MRNLSIAQEGLIFTENTCINKDNIKKHNSAIIFSTTPEFIHGDANIKSLLNILKPKNIIDVNFDTFLSTFLEITEDLNLARKNKAKFSGEQLKYYELVIRLISKIEGDIDDATMGIIVKTLLSILDNIGRNTNTLYCVITCDSSIFSYRSIREYPLIITNGSLAKVFINSIGKNYDEMIYKYQYRSAEFRNLDLKIDKNLFLSNVEKRMLLLFHISKDKNISRLNPRVTHKPLKSENRAVPRISAAPSIDKCLYGVGLGKKALETNLFHVYKLVITDDIRVVRPTPNLVPDINLTNEYWVLDSCSVDYCGSFTANKNDDIGMWEYDTSGIIKSIDKRLTPRKIIR